MFDAVIIGSGLGGLVTAAFLAKEGRKVAVLEKHFVHGGFATSFYRKKWEFDVSLHCLSGLGEDGRIRHIFEQLGLLDRMGVYRADTLYKAVFPDLSLSVPADVELYKQQLFRLYPKEKEGIEALFGTFKLIRDEMLGLTPNREEMSYTRKYQDHSLKDLLDMHIRSSELQCILSQFWGYFGLSPSRLSAAYFSYAWVDYHLHGGFYPDNRSQRLSDALREIIEENGGTFKLREEVEEILVEDGKASAVLTRKGRRYDGEIIVSNINPGQTLTRLKGIEPPKRLLEKVQKLKPSYSCVQAYMTVDCDFARDYGEDHHEIFVNPHYDLDRVDEEIVLDRYESMPFCITIYDNIVPNYQRDGISTVTVMQMSDYRAWETLDKEEYLAKKQKIIERFVRELDVLYPGLSSKIKHVELSTPMTVKRYTNHPQGAIYGAAQTVDQALHRGLSQVTPIRGLYFVGGWARPGAGYSGVISGGYNLARMLSNQKESVF